MIARIDLRIDSFNQSGRANQKTHSSRMCRLFVVTSAISKRHRAIAIAKQQKRKILARRELRDSIERIATDAGHNDIVFVKVFDLVAEAASLERTSGRPRFGIKPKQQAASAKI